MKLYGGHPGMKFTPKSESAWHGCSQALLFMCTGEDPLHEGEMNSHLYLEAFMVLPFKAAICRPQREKNLVFSLLTNTRHD